MLLSVFVILWTLIGIHNYFRVLITLERYHDPEMGYDYRLSNQPIYKHMFELFTHMLFGPLRRM